MSISSNQIGHSNKKIKDSDSPRPNTVHLTSNSMSSWSALGSTLLQRAFHWGRFGIEADVFRHSSSWISSHSRSRFGSEKSPTGSRPGQPSSRTRYFLSRRASRRDRGKGIPGKVNDGKASGDPGGVVAFHWGSGGGATVFGSLAPSRIGSTEPGAVQNDHWNSPLVYDESQRMLRSSSQPIQRCERATRLRSSFGQVWQRND